MKKVSIIVPVYHVAQYLEQCVSSLLNQTYTNIEIILVDDGGDDKCPDMCRGYWIVDISVSQISGQWTNMATPLLLW